MLAIVSDLHLSDGTTGMRIPAGAFELLCERLEDMAYRASQRLDGTYRPIESFDLLLLGDILDPLHSTLWLDTAPGDAGYTRPWTSSRAPLFAAKLAQTTRSCPPQAASLIKS